MAEGVQRWRGSSIVVAAVAGVFVWLTRMPFRAERLTDWDSVNFALALDRWDLALHQPHPPGYLGYVVLAWPASLVTDDPNAALVLVAALAAVAAAVVLWKLAAAVGVGVAARWAGIAAFLTSPLVWFYSSVAEVYALEMLCALLVAAACLRLRRRESSLGPLVLAFAACALVKPPTALMLLPLAACAPADWASARRRLTALGAGAAGVAAVMIARAIGDPAMPALFLEQFVEATQGTRLAAGGDAPFFRELNRHVRDILQAFVMIGAGCALALPYAAWRAIRTQALDRVWAVGWMAPMLGVFVFLHFAKPGYLLPLAPLAFLALMVGLAPQGRRGTAMLAGVALAGAVQFVVLGPLPATMTGGDLRYGDKTLLQKIATDLEPVTFASAATISGTDARIDQVRRAVERCPADGVVLVSEGGAINWRQAMYYLPAQQVVRVSALEEPLLIGQNRRMEVRESIDQLRSVCRAIWIGAAPAAIPVAGSAPPVPEPILPGVWSLRGRFSVDVGASRILTVEPSESAR